MGYEYFYQNFARWLLLSMLVSIESPLQILILDNLFFYFFNQCSPYQEYPKHEIYIASDYKISCSISAWFSRIMEATAHQRDISTANLIGERRRWTAWHWWSIEFDLPIRINHSRRLHSRESKSCHHILIQWVGPATCRLDKDDRRDVSWSWFDTKAKQHVCLKAS